MKKLFICLLSFAIAMPVLAAAQSEIQFAWTPQTYSSTAGYMLFCRREGERYDYTDPIWQGDATFTQCAVDGLEDNTTYYFVIRTIDVNDNQSYDSNEIVINESSATEDSIGTGNSAGLGGNGGSTSTFSSCFIQSLLPHFAE